MVLLWQSAFAMIFKRTSPAFGGATMIVYIKSRRFKEEAITSILRGLFGSHATAALQVIGFGTGSTPRAKKLPHDMLRQIMFDTTTAIIEAWS
jgi:hypothetical protein